MADDKPKSLFHQELERRANDLIKVFNPTDKDYIVEWSRRDGSKLFRVPAKSDAILIRYIAEKYLQEMFDKLMVDKANAAVIAENEKRIAKGMEEMTKWKDQVRFESQYYNPSLEESKKLLATLYGGVVQEFGVDRAGAMQAADQIPTDKPAFQAAWEEISKQKPIPAPKPEEIPQKKVEQIKKEAIQGASA